eukprot:gene373-435_t
MSVTLHTSLGDIKVEVFCDSVPQTAENFLALCASNYYDGTHFHRNIRTFMVQGGDPTNTGRGGQIFGKVIDGMEVLDQMERMPVDAKDTPLTDIILKSVTIHANPLAI